MREWRIREHHLGPWTHTDLPSYISQYLSRSLSFFSRASLCWVITYRQWSINSLIALMMSDAEVRRGSMPWFDIVHNLYRLPEKTCVSLGMLEPLTVDHNKLENSSRDGNTGPPYLPPEKSVWRSRRNITGHKTTDWFQIGKRVR